MPRGFSLLSSLELPELLLRVLLQRMLQLNPLMHTVAFNICCPRDCVSRHIGEQRVPPLNPSESVFCCCKTVFTRTVFIITFLAIKVTGLNFATDLTILIYRIGLKTLSEDRLIVIMNIIPAFFIFSLVKICLLLFINFKSCFE